MYDSHGDHESTTCVRALYRKEVKITLTKFKQGIFKLQRVEAVGRPSTHPGDTGRPPTLSFDKQTEVNLYKTNIPDSDAKTLYIPVVANSKKTFGVVDTAAQVSVISKTFFSKLTYKPEIKGSIILKGAGACSEIKAGIAEKLNLDIGSSTVKWDMVVAEITDNIILGIDFLESQKAIIDLPNYSIKLKGENIPSFMTSNRQDQQMKIYRIKIKKKTVIPPCSSKVTIVELDEKPMNDIVIQPTNFMNGLLVPNMLCMGTSNWNADRKEVPQYIKDLVENLKKVHDIARDNLKASQERQKGIYDLKYNQNIYNVGDVVYKLNQATKVGQSGKLKSPWKGPYLITAWRSPVLYKIKDRKTESWIHHDRIKLCEDRELSI
ncbi:unnamed protein product [Mytilus coruscus]|uniref:Peptidase A2 domain-containing protein n=1 Tax=Mytilus coruscus TaxID=42192 RepID=A0A6J8EUF6_MYTCO|nr:unnamed protein product [Mytilus coruscus]